QRVSRRSTQSIGPAARRFTTPRPRSSAGGHGKVAVSEGVGAETEAVGGAGQAVAASLSGAAYLVGGGPGGQGWCSPRSRARTTTPGPGHCTASSRTASRAGSPRWPTSSAASRAGDVTVEKTEIVFNAEVVKWSILELRVTTE